MPPILLALKNAQVFSADGVESWFFDDRGFVYGDGYFDTMRSYEETIPLWEYHRERMLCSAKSLLFFEDYQQQGVFENCIDQSYLYISEWLKKNTSKFSSDFFIKFIVTRGERSAGSYALEKSNINVYVSVKAFSERPYVNTSIKLVASPLILQNSEILSGIKHLNRLDYILAAKACFLNDSDLIDTQVLFVNNEHNIVETMHHNIYVMLDGKLLTPNLEKLGVNGVMRRYIFDVCESENFSEIIEKNISLSDLSSASSVFLSNAVDGMVKVSKISVPNVFSTTLSELKSHSVKYCDISKPVDDVSSHDELSSFAVKERFSFGRFSKNNI